MSIRQNEFSSKWVFVKMSIRQNEFSSKWVFVSLSFRQNAFSSKWAFVKMNENDIFLYYSSLNDNLINENWISQIKISNVIFESNFTHFCKFFWNYNQGSERDHRMASQNSLYYLRTIQYLIQFLNHRFLGYIPLKKIIILLLKLCWNTYLLWKYSIYHRK